MMALMVVWLVRIAAGLVVLVVVAVVLFVVLTRNPDPDDFYAPPDEVTAEAGAILRSEPFDRGLPEGARGWRVLYASTDEHGDPIAVSGLVLAPEEVTPGPHPVLAWAHGTTGIARPCAPSLSDEPLEGVPDLTGLLARGWVVTLTDYPGLGTPAPHPYLVGASEGRAVLDSVRVAHDLDTGVELSDDYAIWGHSQGGHAALFAGQLADDYLAELDLDLVGVAALAPATRLQDNLVAVEGTEAGNVLTILAVEAWSQYYPDISIDILRSRARRPAGRIADACLNQPSRFRIVVAGLTLPDTVLARDVAEDPTWRRRLDQNTPDPSGFEAPLFVAQGLADEIVAPAVTEAWVAERCRAGSTAGPAEPAGPAGTTGSAGPTEWRTYAGVTHAEIVGPGGADALAWTVDQFEGTETSSRCPAVGG
jgi:alpha-beta hydrolase superfamily lysophospholipase